MSKTTEYMLAKMKDALDEADTLGTAIWGGVPNAKSQVFLDRRKETLVGQLEQLIRFLSQLKEDVLTLRMDNEESPDN